VLGLRQEKTVRGEATQKKYLESNIKSKKEHQRKEKRLVERRGKLKRQAKQRRQ